MKFALSCPEETANVIICEEFFDIDDFYVLTDVLKTQIT